MINDQDPSQSNPPIVLGASGRIGTGFQRLALAGHWPGPVPLWQARPGAALVSDTRVDWDMLTAAPPDIGRLHGVICLAGAVSGDMTVNTNLALAAIDLARTTGSGPVLLTSTAAVYGPSDSAVTERADCLPTAAYGRAKLAMETAVSARLHDLGDRAPKVCILRIGNVAGADALLLAAARGVVTLDQFEDRQGPERSYIGMLGLAQVMVRLITRFSGAGQVPPILNVAAPQPVRMVALLQAAGLTWDWKPAPATALRRMVLDTALLDSLILPDPACAEPAELIRQSRLAGWVAA